MDFWINFFKMDMKEMKHFDKSNLVQVKCLRYCFGPLIKLDLETTRKEWNRHTIRKQKTGDIKSGKPNYLYYVPEKNGAVDCKQEVNQEHIQNAINNYTQKPTYSSDAFTGLLKELFDEPLPSPVTPEEGVVLYHQILSEIDKYSEE